MQSQRVISQFTPGHSFPWEGSYSSLWLRHSTEWTGNQGHEVCRGCSAKMQSEKSLDLQLQWNVCSSVDPQRLKTTDLQYVTYRRKWNIRSKKKTVLQMCSTGKFLIRNMLLKWTSQLFLLTVLWFVSLSRLGAYRWDIFLDEAGLSDWL